MGELSRTSAVAMIVDHRAWLELDLLGSMAADPSRAHHIAIDQGIRAGIFDDPASRLIFACFQVLRQLNRLSGSVDEDRHRLFSLICDGLNELHVVQWRWRDTTAEGWSFARRWNTLRKTYSWSPVIVGALFESYPIGTAAVARNARRLVEFHQQYSDAIRHLEIGGRMMRALIGAAGRLN